MRIQVHALPHDQVEVRFFGSGRRPLHFQLVGDELEFFAFLPTECPAPDFAKATV